MQFIIAGLLALVATASAIPTNSHPGSKPGDITVMSQKCGKSQVLSCCNTYNINVGEKDDHDHNKRWVDPLKELDYLLEEIGGLFGDKTCYRQEGTICPGVSACCSGNGKQCTAIDNDDYKKHPFLLSKVLHELIGS